MLKKFIAVFALFLSACASVPTPVVNGRLSPAPGQGLAIIALTAKSFSDDTANLSLQIKGPNGGTSGHLNLITDFIRSPGDTPNTTGQLLVLPLAPGQHMIKNASGSWRNPSNGAREYINVNINHPFTIAAGEVVYLGQVHVNMNFQPDAEFSQNTERDFFDLKARRGVTDFSNIVIRPLNAAATVQ